jgi:hypothetical protein
MKKLRLREWVPGRRKHEAWRSHREERWPDVYLATSGIPASKLPPSGASGTWEGLARKIHEKTGIDLWDSEASFVWEATGCFAQVVDEDFLIPATTKEWVLLFEGLPEAGYILPCRPLRIGEFPSPAKDLYIAPWPRLNWLLMLTHENSIGPYFISLK